MSENCGELQPSDRVIAWVVLATGAAAGVAAPILASPWALENGWQSSRFVVFLAAVVAAWWIGGAAATSVIRKLRQR